MITRVLLSIVFSRISLTNKYSLGERELPNLMNLRNFAEEGWVLSKDGMSCMFNNYNRQDNMYVEKINN